MSATSFDTLLSASGSAAPIPGIIERLRSLDREVRQRALVRLYYELYREGFPYSASVPAVALLASLAVDTSVLDRHRILIFLHDLAKRAPAYARFGLGADTASSSANPLFTHVSEALSAEETRLEPLLDDADARVRTAAAWLLAHLPDPSPALASHLRSRLSIEVEPRTQASIALALGHVGRAVLDLPALDGLRVETEHALVRGSSAVASVRLGATLDAPLIHDLALALRLPRERDEVLRVNQTSGVFPWGRGSLAVYAAPVFASLEGDGARARITVILMDALRARLDAGQRLVAEADRTGDVVLADEVF